MMAGGLIAIYFLVAAMIQVITGQQIYLRLSDGPKITTNNTEILIADIGEYATYGLACHTDLTECCRSRDHSENVELGEWYYPNKLKVKSYYNRGYSDSFYVERNAQVIELVHFNNIETGSYCCTVPTTGGNMTLCANLVLCPSLPELDNGTVTYYHTHDTYDCSYTEAKFSCNSGYVLTTGTKYSTQCCNSNGVWSRSALTCVVAAPCPLLPPLPNGIITYTDEIPEVGTEATHICNHGYVLLGDTTRICQFNQQWSSISQPAHCADQAFVQLKFGPTKYCLDWSPDLVRDTREAILQTIKNVIRAEKNDYFSSNHISDGVFSCYGSKDYTTYRTTITGTRSLDAETAAFYIQKWVESGEAIQFEWYLMYFDPECSVRLTSLSDAECSGVLLN